MLYFRDKCLRNFVIANMLLKKGAAAGLTLHQIASIIYKEEEDDASVLNNIVNKAEFLANIEKY